MTVDVFCHIYPNEYLKTVKEMCKSISFETDNNSDTVILFNKDLQTWTGFYKKDSHCVIPELRLKHMDQYGIDTQVLTIALPGLEPTLLGANAETTVKIAKISNDTMSNIVEKHRGRFLGVAEIPVLSGDEALDEADRALGGLGLSAIQLYTQMGGITLDSDKLFPLYDRISKYDVPILVHPSNPPPKEYRSYERDFLLYYIFGWPYETTLAFSRVVFSDLFLRFPKLKFISHHMGGMIAFHGGRIQLFEQEAVTEKKRTTEEYLKDFKAIYHDTAVLGNLPAVRCGYEFFGPKQLLFATDYPFGQEYGLVFLRDTLKSIKALALPKDEEELILERNARRLFKS
jgi:predicted TIM-barrel fold metal-dependent hydrolase